MNAAADKVCAGCLCSARKTAILPMGILICAHRAFCLVWANCSLTFYVWVIYRDPMWVMVRRRLLQSTTIRWFFAMVMRWDFINGTEIRTNDFSINRPNHFMPRSKKHFCMKTKAYSQPARSAEMRSFSRKWVTTTLGTTPSLGYCCGKDRHHLSTVIEWLELAPYASNV